MSFDCNIRSVLLDKRVSIPFDQGNVFRLKAKKEDRKVSRGLNPFRSGQCLSTDENGLTLERILVSIPFDQGNVFRLQRYAGGRNHAAFQTYFPIFLEG